MSGSVEVSLQICVFKVLFYHKSRALAKIFQEEWRVRTLMNMFGVLSKQDFIKCLFY